MCVDPRTHTCVSVLFLLRLPLGKRRAAQAQPPKSHCFQVAYVGRTKRTNVRAMHTNRGGGGKGPQRERQNHQNRNCGSTSCRAICRTYCRAPNKNSITRRASRDDAMVNKKGGETKSHLALFTGALVLEEKSIQGLQNNPSVPPWYPHRKIQKKKSLQQGIHYSAASGKERGGEEE